MSTHLRLAVLAFVAVAFTAPSWAATPEPRGPVEITYLGNAGWQITDGKKVILVDPWISEFHNGGNPTQITTDDPVATPDTALIDAHVHKADYILITHGHEDHMLDAPYIAKKTGAAIICTESTANIARANGVGDHFTPENFDPALVKNSRSSSSAAARISSSTASRWQ
jgi:L-ascorbate metabolism protein UlaG (beta-lactamase superfamily)